MAKQINKLQVIEKEPYLSIIYDYSKMGWLTLAQFFPYKKSTPTITPNMSHIFYTDPDDIINWLNTMGITKYDLVPDKDFSFLVNVYTSVNLQSKKLNFLPIKFDLVLGSFNCRNNNLTTLLGSPKRIRGDFDCGFNNLTNLLHSPNIIGNHFNAANNKLINLEGVTPNISRMLIVQDNELTSLEFIPQSVGHLIYIGGNPHPLLKGIKIPILYKALYELHKISLEKNLLENTINKEIKSASDANNVLLHKI